MAAPWHFRQLASSIGRTSLLNDTDAGACAGAAVIWSVTAAKQINAAKAMCLVKGPSVAFGDCIALTLGIN
jgi:hypothetical protein